jgi:hypothetical protein
MQIHETAFRAEPNTFVFAIPSRRDSFHWRNRQIGSDRLSTPAYWLLRCQYDGLVSTSHSWSSRHSVHWQQADWSIWWDFVFLSYSGLLVFCRASREKVKCINSSENAVMEPEVNQIPNRYSAFHLALLKTLFFLILRPLWSDCLFHDLRIQELGCEDLHLSIVTPGQAEPRVLTCTSDWRILCFCFRWGCPALTSSLWHIALLMLVLMLGKLSWFSVVTIMKDILAIYSNCRIHSSARTGARLRRVFQVLSRLLTGRILQCVNNSFCILIWICRSVRNCSGVDRGMWGMIHSHGVSAQWSLHALSGAHEINRWLVSRILLLETVTRVLWIDFVYGFWIKTDPLEKHSDDQKIIKAGNDREGPLST